MYQQAAAQGNADAQYGLGACYFENHVPVGVVAATSADSPAEARTLHMAEAVRLWRLAAAQGDAHARIALAELAASLETRDAATGDGERSLDRWMAATQAEIDAALDRAFPPRRTEEAASTR
jgi:TPR repeat protein